MDNRATIPNKKHEQFTASPLIRSGILIGVGMGGFVDGIVLHQILQWHEMLSHKLPPDTLENKSINMFWDGLFHAFTWIVTAIGIALLWKVAQRNDVLKSTTTFLGSLWLGWGLFNVVEGIIDHQILRIHIVKENSVNPEMWNLGFLAVSVVMMIFGWMMIKNGIRKHQY